MKTFPLFLFILLLFSCRKDEFNPSQIDFTEKPLDVIKASIRGTWQVYSASGGLAGQTEYPNDFYMGFNDSSVDVIREDTVYRTEIVWAKKISVTGERTYIMESPNGGFYKVPARIFNDTLLLYDNHAEGYVYLLTRADVDRRNL